MLLFPSTRALTWRETSCANLRKRNPKRAERHIACGTLTPADGRMKQTGKVADHYSWWAFDGIVRHRSFQVVERN